ncbi:phosphoribosylglycinamide formyltransferase [Marinilactibacillus sp. GCM10026970]|uniref:phosphoribosylglycinamide formyltransferase n=1 Tax=Marinilactibacillus sp. GCM10026970 TaxID=3252642 RepID=UPI0036172213
MNNQKNLKIAIFASGNGSNFEVIAEAVQKGSIKAELSLLICDQPEAYVLKRAEIKAVPSIIIQPSDYKTKKAFETVLLKHLENHEIDLIVLAGYMRIIGKTLLEKYTERIINIHPSLLPDFPGESGIGDAFAAGVKETGVTVHLVDQGVDTGPILSQQKVMVESDETLESLGEKIHKLEHSMYPNVIQAYIEKLQKEQVNS